MTEIKIVQLIKDFNINELQPVNLVIGKEELLKKQLSDKLKAVKGDDIHILWGDETSLNELEEIFSSSSLFSDGNVVVLWDFEGFLKNLKKDSQKKFLDLLRKINSPDRLFLMSDKEKFPSKEPYKSIKEFAGIIVSPPLSPKGFLLSIKKKIENSGKKIDEKSLLYLSKKFKNDLFYAKQEIEKLLNYVADKDEITIDDIDAVVIPKVEESVFVFIDKFFNRDPDAVKIFINLLETTHHPFEIQSLILNQLNKILVFKTLLEEGKPLESIYNQLNIKSPAQKGTVRKLASMLTKDEIINMIKRLYQLEIDQKVYYRDIYDSSVDYIIEMVNG
ncbi:DNA polymerase III subunit delta [Persephonella sp.]